MGSIGGREAGWVSSQERIDIPDILHKLAGTTVAAGPTVCC